jgi:hypothetical protein
VFQLQAWVEVADILLAMGGKRSRWLRWWLAGKPALQAPR